MPASCRRFWNPRPLSAKAKSPHLVPILSAALTLSMLCTPALAANSQGAPRTRPQSDSPADPYQSQGQLATDNFHYNLEDKKRGKTIDLSVTYPRGKGPFPVIVWSHGAFGGNEYYQPLVKHWASHGYIVVQPTHEDSLTYCRQQMASSGGFAAGGGREGIKAQFEQWKARSFQNWPSRPLDVSLILDNLEKITASSKALAGKARLDDTGVGGHSFGAHTAQILGGTEIAGSRKYEDSRPRAFLMISPQGREDGFAGRSTLHDQSWKGFTRPMMVVTGTRDEGRNGQGYEWRMDPYKLSPPGDKYLMVVQDASHGFGGITARNADGIEERGGPRAGPPNQLHVTYVKAATLAYWDTYLKGSSQARNYLKTRRLASEYPGALTLSLK